MSNSYDMSLGEDWLAVGKALLEYTAEQGAAVRISKGNRSLLLKQAAATAARFQSKSYRCKQPMRLKSVLMNASEVEHEVQRAASAALRLCCSDRTASGISGRGEGGCWGGS